VETTANYITDAQVILFSPQLSFVKEQDGKLKMNKEGMNLHHTQPRWAHEWTKLSFPINEQNNLPLAWPMWVDPDFFTFCVMEGAIHFSATAEMNPQMTSEVWTSWF
jgi:hypothetical protein